MKIPVTTVGVFLGLLVSTAFVPSSGVPAWLRAIADWNPVSAAVAACRSPFGNPGIPATGTAWPLEHPAGWQLRE